MPKRKKKAWVVTVDMGYGHQRAAYPLNYFAEGGIISANNYSSIPKRDRNIWHQTRSFYEFISRFKKVPVIGTKAFELYDKLQSIPDFYPRRDLSKANTQLKQMYNLFEVSNWGKHLIDKLAKLPLPIVTTFFTTAMMADFYGYPGDILCLATDTDISRAWVPPEPAKSKIVYLAPNRRVAERLKLYGVRPDKIFLTGFPLPLENVGNNLKIIKHDLGRRLAQLDPERIYINQYEKTLRHYLGNYFKKTISRPLTITFAVGGAGAQRELGGEIIKSLRQQIGGGQIRVNLVAGIHNVVNRYFRRAIKEAGLQKTIGSGVNIIFDANKYEYFKKFNQTLRTTDVLWTKPSELSFYCALGLPIIMAPHIGSQEIFNEKWLQSIGAGINQEDPRYTSEWLSDWLKSGWLAEAAMQGFLEAPKYGTFNVEKITFHRFKEAKKIKTVLQY